MVERRSPKPEVVGSSPSAPAKINKIMKNPLRFLQEVKQETFKLPGPQKNDDGCSDGFRISINSCIIFFLILDQILRFLLNLILTINF